MMADMITLIPHRLLRDVRAQRALVLENLALRHQLTVLGAGLHPKRPPSVHRRVIRVSHDDLMAKVFEAAGDQPLHFIWVPLSRLWWGWTEAVAIVQPEMVIRWHRTGSKLLWT
jgi:hypothetical protein